LPHAHRYGFLKVFLRVKEYWFIFFVTPKSLTIASLLLELIERQSNLGKFIAYPKIYLGNCYNEALGCLFSKMYKYEGLGEK